MASGFIDLRLSQYPPIRGAGGTGDLDAPAYSNFLDLPIPAVATVGTFVVKPTSTTLWYTFRIKSGDKIIVKTGSTYYTYYATADVDAVNYDQPISIPVLPAIQTTHAEWDMIGLPSQLWNQRIGETVIGPMLPSSVGSYRAYADALYEAEVNTAGQCMPYVRAWPDANDPIGIPWDQSNLLSLSFLPLNGSDHRELLDAYASTNIFDTATGLTYQQWRNRDRLPVPKVIAAGYTKRTRRDGARYRVQSVDYYTDFLRVRTATGYHARNPSIGGALTSGRYEWAPAPQIFDNRLCATNPFGSTGGSINYDPATNLVTPHLSMNRDRQIAGGSSQWAGSRGGRYSLSGYAQNGGGGPTCGFDLEIWTTDPGAADIKLVTIAVADNSAAAVVRSTGAWTDLRLPTGVGTCGTIYAKAFPYAAADAVYLYDTRLGVSIYGAGHAPWCHSIATGNLVAPGGLIAPFY